MPYLLSRPSFGAATLAMLVASFVSSSGNAACTGRLFSPQAVYNSDGNYPHGAAFADFNGDGILDLAVANSGPTRGSDLISVRLGVGSGGVGNGSFGPSATFPAGVGPWAVVAGDFNADGKSDLAVANFASANVSILEGNGDGTFQPPANFSAGPNPFFLVTGDFNHDGATDLAVASNGDSAVFVLLGHGDASFAAPVRYGIAERSSGITAGDLNGDGILDLVATSNYAGVLSVLIGHGTPGAGDGTFAPVVNYAANSEPFAVALADLDEDGKLDAVAGDAGFNGVAILRGNGDGSFGAPVIYNDGTQNAGIVIGDWNHDGILDLATADGRNDVMYTLLGQGAGGVGNGTFGAATSYPAGAVSFPMTGADVNNDGAMDLLTVNYSDNSVSLFLAACDAAPPPPPPSNAPVITDVRDVPHDQGGRVFMTWLASALDNRAQHAITAYRVWRRIHPEGTAAARAVPASLQATSHAGLVRTTSPTGATVVYWEALADLPAQQLEGYGYTAATTQDSIEDSNPYTAFFVTALTSNPSVFYSSAVDSGYSVDNLPPQEPKNPAGAVGASGYTIAWDPPDQALDPDVDHYAIYRGNTPNFSLDVAHRIGQPIAQEFVDAGSDGGHYYQISAVDTHGNESPASELMPASNVDVGDATVAFALRGAAPNPARPSRVAIAFSLPNGAKARLEMFDASGRRVAAREVGGLGAGSHVVNLAEGRMLSAGIYAVRLTQGDRSRTIKATVAP